MSVPSILFLDVDDTLYPHSCGLWAAVGERIQSYLETRVGLPPSESKVLRLRFLGMYGTTLRGLQTELEVDTEDYLDYVHDVPIDQLLKPNPDLHAMLQEVQGKIYYFTNAYRPYTERVLDRLGILDLGFEIIDIRALDFENKPLPGAYRRALAIAGDPSPAGCVLVDDRPANLLPAAELGMQTVLVGQGPEGFENGHHVIPLITDLLTAVPGLREL